MTIWSIATRRSNTALLTRGTDGADAGACPLSGSMGSVSAWGECDSECDTDELVRRCTLGEETSRILSMVMPSSCTGRASGSSTLGRSGYVRSR